MSAPPVDQAPRRARGSSRPVATPERLPAPVRERRPALAALAVLLIVGGALLSALVVLRTGERSEYLVLSADIDPGQRISRSDLGVADLAGSGVSAIPAAQRASIVGQYATTRLFKGQLAIPSMFSAGRKAPAGAAVVGVLLPDGQRPTQDLQAGDVVSLYEVNIQDASAEAPTSALVDAARVVDVGAAEGTIGNAGVGVSVLIPEDKVAAVTAAAAGKRISAVLLPAGTRPDVDYTSSDSSGTAGSDGSGG